MIEFFRYWNCGFFPPDKLPHGQNPEHEQKNYKATEKTPFIGSKKKVSFKEDDKAAEKAPTLASMEDKAQIVKASNSEVLVFSSCVFLKSIWCEIFYGIFAIFCYVMSPGSCWTSKAKPWCCQGSSQMETHVIDHHYDISIYIYYIRIILQAFTGSIVERPPVLNPNRSQSSVTSTEVYDKIFFLIFAYSSVIGGTYFY